MSPARRAGPVVAALALLVAAGLAVLAGAAHPAGAAPAVAAPTTTVPGIAGRLPPPPSTVPFRTRALSAHVSPVYPRLSMVGFGLFVVIALVQLVLTRKRRRGRWTL